jgi:signal transduction histidine kinase
MHADETGAPLRPPHGTWFAPAERTSPADLDAAITAACGSPVVDAILRAVGCVVAVVNPQRQIVAVNDVMLDYLGVGNPRALLGLRLGEALDCIHAGDEAGGCGTSRACSSCGAAIAMLVAGQTGNIQERECLISLRQGKDAAIELRARALPMAIDGRELLVLVLQDIRDEKRRQALECVFFHDLSNTLTGLVGCADLLREAGPARVATLLPLIDTSVRQLLEEVESQRILSLTETNGYRPVAVDSSAAELLEDVAVALRSHRVAYGRTLRVVPPSPDVRLCTDIVLLRRVLINMGKNALEGTPVGGEARMWVQADPPDGVAWLSWNDAFIPPDVAVRIFQRSFSTKGEKGRGLGTYGMRLLGERFLGGRATFTSSPEGGTTFHFRHPLTLPSPNPAAIIDA